MITPSKTKTMIFPLLHKQLSYNHNFTFTKKAMHGFSIKRPKFATTIYHKTIIDLS